MRIVAMVYHSWSVNTDATTNTKGNIMTMPQLPREWADAEVMDGLDLIDKAELVATPFLITGVQFTTNERGVSFVYVDAENTRGERFTFNDSSTGVRQQIVKWLTDRGQDSAIDSGELVPMRNVAPRGLRVSSYEVTDPNDRRKMKQSRTYYLTTSGERFRVPAEKPLRTPTRKRATRTTKPETPAETVESAGNAE